MNMSSEENTVQWLFIDLNSYFASWEQQERPKLRGKPIIVVQSVTKNACAIAALFMIPNTLLFAQKLTKIAILVGVTFGVNQ
ncbi:MAG: hypothetical protein M3N08_05295 [Pseudomonadota bacterium]|nr:hypothetical protein [Pseudomonadota bacterium]